MTAYKNRFSGDNLPIPMTQPEEKILECLDPAGEQETHRMVYYEWGNPLSERVVVCVHGLTRNGRDFDFLAQALSKDFRVICPDIVGRGKSAWLRDPKWYGYPLYVSDMLMLLRHLGVLNVDWVGTSMGGLIGMLLAASVPHFIGRLVLNDLGPFIPKEALYRIAEYTGREVEFASRAEAESHMRTISQPFGITDEAHWEHLYAHSIIEGEEGACHMNYDPRIGMAFWNKRGKIRKLEDIDLWSHWEAVHCPTLVLRGETSDLLTRETVDQMQHKPEVTGVVEFPDIGHAPSLMDPKQIEIVREWLLAYPPEI